MNNFLSLLRGSLLRSKTVLIMSLIVSLGIAFLSMALFDTSESVAAPINIGFIDEDGSSASKDIARYLEGDLKMNLVRSENQNSLDSELVEKNISGIVSIPKGFENAMLSGGGESKTELTFLGDYANEAFVRGYIDAYMDSLAILAAASDGDSTKLKSLIDDAAKEGVNVSESAKDNEIDKMRAGMEGLNAMIGFFMMIFFMMSIGICAMLNEDRIAGTYRRIKASKVTSVQYVASVATVGFVISLLIEGPSLVLYSISGSYSGVPIGIIVLLLLVFTLFVVAFSLFVGIAASGTNGIVAIVIAVSCITSMLGGAWFPIDLAPPIFQTLSYGTPQRWVFEAISSYQNGAGNAVMPVIIILLAALLFFILAGIRFASNKSAAKI